MKVVNFLNTILNLTLVSGIVFLMFNTAGTNADTTGIEPMYLDNYKEIKQGDYILNTLHNYDYSGDDIHCLAENMYHEARSDGDAGMYAVAMVTINRVYDHRYPNTVCEVVKQGPVRESWKTRQHKDLPDDQRIYYPRRHKCQFSWYCDGKSDKMYDTDAFFTAVEIAELVVEGSMGLFPLIDITEGATHYHTIEVAPDWRFDRGMTLIGRIGHHLFYRWN